MLSSWDEMQTWGAKVEPVLLACISEAELREFTGTKAASVFQNKGHWNLAKVQAQSWDERSVVDWNHERIWSALYFNIFFSWWDQLRANLFCPLFTFGSVPLFIRNRMERFYIWFYDSVVRGFEFIWASYSSVTNYICYNAMDMLF